MVRKLPLPDISLSPVAHDLQSLGTLIRSQRGRCQLRIDDAADLLNVSKDLLSRLEDGRSVGLDGLMKVLDGLGLKLLVVPKGDALLLEDRLTESWKEA
ncbi:helix-turn-helix domain-containing protein [Cupriavidus gilardii]|uniref:helix-turn-helix domain-containing protein n=1 Tax=Cupriavidus gilardii TaxID=82541 RepID=UPI0007E3BE7A|nr:helix-turn-helix transcriptional regulator [Cupriavidus gilardii]